MALVLGAAALTGCATVRPDEALRSTRELLDGRHPGELAWLRDSASQAAAAARVREILAEPLEPESAAVVALLRNPGLQATLEELGVAQADLAQATRLANPGLSFTDLSGDGAGQRTVSVTGDIVDWLVQPLRRRLAAAELERTKLEVGHALLDVVADARRALIRHQAAGQLGERLGQIAELERAAADYARALFQAGNLTALELANAEASWAEARAAAGRARLDVLRSREEVNRALGLAGDDDWSAAPELDLPLEESFDVVELQERAAANRLDLAAARWAVNAVGRALALKKGTRFLPLGVEVGVERERESGGARLTGPTIDLRLPLFDTGKASVARLEAELARARWQHVALDRHIRSEIRERAAELEAAGQLIALYRDTILPRRAEVLERTLLEYNQMLLGTFDVLFARQQVAEAERSAIEALTLYWEARIDLDRATGGRLPLHPETAAAGGTEKTP